MGHIMMCAYAGGFKVPLSCALCATRRDATTGRPAAGASAAWFRLGLVGVKLVGSTELDESLRLNVAHSVALKKAGACAEAPGPRPLEGAGPGPAQALRARLPA